MFREGFLILRNSIRSFKFIRTNITEHITTRYSAFLSLVKRAANAPAKPIVAIRRWLSPMKALRLIFSHIQIISISKELGYSFSYEWFLKRKEIEVIPSFFPL